MCQSNLRCVNTPGSYRCDCNTATSSGEFFRGDFEATSLFGATANSTCGDPPTNFIYNGQLFNCSTGEHASSFAVDGNPNSWWQSTNEEDPVELVFSLIEVAAKGAWQYRFISF